MYSKIDILVAFICSYLVAVQAGVITNYNIDEDCPQDAIVHELRITDCTELPCRIVREKKYTISGEFSVLRNVTAPTLKCSTIYLGRHIELPGHGDCSTLENGTCPLVAGERYTSSTSFRVPYYVPPMMYTIYCSFVDDSDEKMICGWGSGRVV